MEKRLSSKASNLPHRDPPITAACQRTPELPKHVGQLCARRQPRPALTHQETTQGLPGQPWQHHTVWQLWSRSSHAKVQPCFPLQDSF